MKNTIIAIISLLVLLTVCFYGYEFIFKKPLVESPTDTNEDLFTPTVDVKEQYKDGAYTFVGSVEVPSACHGLDASVSEDPTGGSNVSSYMIAVTTVPPQEGIVCAQVVTAKTFKVSVAAPEGSLFKITVDGAEHVLNRFEIPADANIDTYQLELKG
jgi:hypothetical protein